MKLPIHFSKLLISTIYHQIMWILSTATYDIQDARVMANGDNNIIVVVVLAKNTVAKGCFIVLKSVEGHPDVFMALFVVKDGNKIKRTIANVLPSTYHPLLYDLEENGLPRKNPAYKEHDTLTVDGDGRVIVIVSILHFYYSLTGSHSAATSKYMKSASVTHNGPKLIVHCVFEYHMEGMSCVLVYQENGTETLEIVEYPHNTSFPVFLLVDNKKHYTFAVFGKNWTDIDERPIESGQLRTTENGHNNGGNYSLRFMMPNTYTIMLQKTLYLEYWCFSPF